MITPKSIDTEPKSSKHLIIVNSTRTSAGPKLERYLQFAQKNLTVYIEPSILTYPLFEKSSYTIYITDNTLSDTCILSIPFKFNSKLDNIQIEIEKGKYFKNSSNKLVFLYNFLFF